MRPEADRMHVGECVKHTWEAPAEEAGGRPTSQSSAARQRQSAWRVHDGICLLGACGERTGEQLSGEASGMHASASVCARRIASR